MVLQYIDDDEESIVVDSDHVLRKAIQKAVRDSYYENSRETILRLLVFHPNYFLEQN